MESEVWVDQRVVVGPSGIEGRGLFAAGDIAGGEVVVRLGGRLVSSAELADLLAGRGNGYLDTVWVGGDVHLVLPPGTVAHFGNHSCEPSLGFDGPYVLRARRDIAAGEELTVDYAECTPPGGPDPDTAAACRCGAARCRGWVPGEVAGPGEGS